MRQKLRKKEEEKKAKDAKKQEEKEKKLAEDEAKGIAAKKKTVDAILDPTQYTDNRKNWVQALREKNTNPYPHKYNRTLRIDEFCTKYSAQEIANNTFLEDVTESVTGRIMSIRAAGAKLVFLHIHGDEGKLQVIATAQNYTGDFEFLHEALRRGDIIGVTGNPGRTKTNELSIRASKIELLAYCYHMLPTEHDLQAHGLQKETRYRYRYLDLIVNPNVKRIFKIRNQIIDFIRKFLRDEDFLEVETPM